MWRFESFEINFVFYLMIFLRNKLVRLEKTCLIHLHIFLNRHIPVENKKQQYVYPIYYGNSLVAEIIAVRQAYLQNGGNDPDILQQLAQMQAEAQAIDDSLRNRPPPKQKG